MLFARLIGAIRSFDLTAVAVELVVLALGVFVGVQVDRWVEEREAREEDRRYLLSLSEDVATMTTQYEVLAAALETYVAEAVSGLHAIEACNVESDGRDAVLATLSGHQVLPSVPVVRTTYEEMISVGALARIEDAKLKTLLSDFFTRVERAQDNNGYFREDLGRASALLLPRLPFTADANGTLALEEFDAELVCRSIPVRSAMAEILDSRSDLLGQVRLISRQLEDVRTALEANGRAPQER